MATIQCKMCGGLLELPDGVTAAECPYCGNLTTFPKLVDSQSEQLYNRAEQFRRNNDFDRAEQAYTQLIQSNPGDPEAYWGLVLSRYGIEYVEDPATHERIPTCHRVQYEAVTSDPDYLQALEQSSGSERDIYEREAKRIEEIRRGILVISNQEKPYDVFICYKESTDGGTRTQDSVDAQEIYYQLTNQGYKVFFSRITLEGKLGQQYEPYIFAALNSSKVMLVIGSRKEYFDAVWVRNEWSRFIALKKKNPSKLIIPCYKGVNPYDLPVELSRFQAQDMSKIGFIQDLIHGVRKVVDSSRKNEKKESGHGEKNSDSGVENRLRRIKLFLENEEYETVVDYCEKVLDLDAENGTAYFYRLMGELRLNKEDVLIDVEDLENNKTFKLSMRFADEELKEKLKDIVKARAEERRKQEEQRQEEERQRQEEERQRQEMSRKAMIAQQQRLEEERLRQEQFTKIRQESNTRIGLLKSYMNCVQTLHGTKSVLYATLNRCLESESVLVKLEEPTQEDENRVKSATVTAISQLGSLPLLERKANLHKIKKKGIFCASGLVTLFIVVRMISCVYVNSYINSELEAARGAKSESRWDDVYVHAGNILEKDSNHSEAKTLRKNAEYIKDKLSTIRKMEEPRWDDIYAYAKNILEIDSNFAYAQKLLGDCYFNGGGVTKNEEEAVKWYRKAADQGNAEAQLKLGVCYNYGKGVSKDESEAANWYRKAVAGFREAADQGNPEAQYELGDCYNYGIGVSEDESEAVKWYRKSADQGYVDAQYMLGLCYEYGNGVSKDAAEAVKWYRKAADQGRRYCMILLGDHYKNGIGVSKDESEAVNWYRKAADQGHAKAQYKLGDCYKNGEGVPKDAAEAVKWYQKAAEQGNSEAQYKLGDCYKNGEGVPKDAAEAVKWYQKAAEQGYAKAQYELGSCYYFGIGVSKDESEAANWYRKAAAGFREAADQGDAKAKIALNTLNLIVKADQGDAEAQYKLGDCYKNGEGVPKDAAEAVKWYQKAADQGHAKAKIALNTLNLIVKADQGDAEAQYRLGRCYYFGKGVFKDYSEAVKWFRKAAEQGNAYAQHKLGDCYFNGNGVSKDESEAANWYRKAAAGFREAADQGDAEAQYGLGGCYYFGKGVSKDESEAVKWYRKAAKQGYAYAKNALKRKGLSW